MRKSTWKEIKLLILTFVIFCLSMLSAYADLPSGDNTLKEKLDDFFQPTLSKAQLYSKDMVDAGRSGMISRAQLEAGTVAVFRYGNKKASGGYFPESAWATQEIERIIREYWEDGGIDPEIADPDLTPEEKAQKDALTKEARKAVGYSVGEQKRVLETALLEKEKELGRELTPEEKDRIRQTISQTYPLKSDLQTDETEGIAVVSNTNIYKIYNVFSQKGNYSSFLPEYFLFSHILTEEELKRRRIRVDPNFQDFLFARFHIADMTVDYTASNESRLNFPEITLSRAEGKVKKNIPVIISAWTIDPRFIDDGKFIPVLDEKTGKIIGHNNKFGHNNVLVIDGYLEISPYIAKDSKGFEYVDESRVLAVYHTYTRIDPYYKDLTGLTNLFRESEGRRFMEKMVSVIQTKGQ